MRLNVMRTAVGTMVLFSLAWACSRGTPTESIELRRWASGEEEPASGQGSAGTFFSTGSGAVGGSAPFPGTGGSTGGPAFPAPETGPRAISVTAGGRHSCALLENGQVACWGDNADLGDGVTTSSASAVIVANLTDATSVSAGWFHTCARRATGAVVCWGRGDSGQLGQGQMTSSALPVTVVNLTNAVDVSAGSLHTCARRAGAGVVCWGDNQFSQRGTGGFTGSMPVPVLGPTEAGLPDTSAITTGRWHTCAIRNTGAVVCWGRGDAGQVGRGDFIGAPIPMDVLGVSNAFTIGAGWDHTCVATTTNEASCWGRNENGQLGVGAASFGEPASVRVAGLTDAVQVAGGGFHTCARRSSGQVVCWGDGTAGALGDGMRATSFVPVPVAGLTQATSIATGERHSCAARASGGIVCWGFDGVEDSGVAVDSAVPVPIPGLPDVLCYGVSSALPCSFTRVRTGTNVRVAAKSSEITIDFPAVTQAGEAAALGSGVGQPPPLGFAVVETGQPLSSARYWTIATTAQFTGPATVCIYSNPSWPFGPDTRLLQDTGSGYVDITTPNPLASVVCGLADTLPPTLVSQAPPGPQACSSPADCGTGFCVDGFCCDTACGDGNADDCLACSVAAGATQDGTCTVTAGTPCRTGPGACDVADVCNGMDTNCPGVRLPDGSSCPDDGNACTLDKCNGESGDCQHPPGNKDEVCRNAVGVCDLAELCTGNSASCPADTAFPECAPAPVSQMPACTPPACTDVDAGGGVELTFRGGVTLPGDVGVIETIAAAAPPTGYQIVGLGPFNWDINTTAGYTPPITVCISYAEFLGLPGLDEAALRLWHYEGSNWVSITSDLCMSNAVCPDAFPCMSPCADPATICGSTNSLSPFAIFQAIDTTGPAFGAAPDIVAYATSTSGAPVTYALPTAVDAVDGQRPVACSPASGSLFAPGKTTVTCTAADTVGNSSGASFVVWVQYQAPADGSFFLRPIRPDGSSVFQIGRPVPVRFRLAGASAGITNLSAKLIVKKVSDAVHGTVEDLSDESVDDTDMTFKYRPLLRLYAYRWKTSDQGRGTYRLRADLGDEVVHQIEVSLKSRR